ncbi:hypothetical protein OH76DRAFT_277169 [Lentinus brumalis]|uniref:Uncharacterized protein n=1 Tax=Lentinus brumalis TaxID=2498619 RepID=A0A371CKZ6_9APHY|nr:hypothetical protein OH76DRAFT_277169 [Polyporus brumalis]
MWHQAMCSIGRSVGGIRHLPDFRRRILHILASQVECLQRSILRQPLCRDHVMCFCRNLGVPCSRPSDCANLPIFEGVSTIVPYLSWAVFSAFRVYALTDRNRCLAIVVFILVASFLVPNIYEYAGFDNVNLPAPYDCSRAVPPGAVLKPRYASCQHTRRSHCSGYHDSEDIRVVVRRTETGPTSSSRRSASDQRCSMFQHPTGSERSHISPDIGGL